MNSEKHLTMTELEAGLDAIRQAPKNEGVLELIVRRPQIDDREILEVGELDVAEGLVGDNWRVRGRSRTTDGTSHPDMQLNIMNARVIALVAQDKDRWQLAGDQLFIDLDLSTDNLHQERNCLSVPLLLKSPINPCAGYLVHPLDFLVF
jgi:hypothetical protein